MPGLVFSVSCSYTCVCSPLYPRAQSRPVLSCVVLTHPVSLRHVYLASSSAVMLYRVLSCPVLSCPFLPCPVMPCPALSCPVLSCPVLSCPVLSCPVLSCPILSFRLMPRLDVSCVMFDATFLFCVFRSARCVTMPASCSMWRRECMAASGNRRRQP